MNTNEYKELIITNTITHGITAVIDGTVKVDEEKTLSFYHIFRFNKFKDGKIKEITSYIIENK
ncbi:hypothetical protein [Bacillus gaemokensis]|uniref:hypothetical protein n=1 Tax=Bacillus gaemokensis TaxID=574375 RepID=UPI00068D5762|nr:hypothetical protein [Bacillus gaemokensis]KYG39375.1 hypothetical protein AZF08_04915 [Bacillus gaemokensis]